LGAALPSNAALLLPYALPYALYVAVAALGEGWLSRAGLCALQLALAGPALLWAWGSTGPLRGPRPLAGSLAWGVLAGALGTAVWIAGCDRFVAPGGAPWGPGYVALRVLASAALVPVFEEQLLRGYALRVATQWDLARRDGEPQPWETAFHARSALALDPRAATPLGVAISSVLFALGHSVAQWPVALAYGLGMALLYRTRADLASCVAAHATTNALLLAYAVATARWSL
jgi:hypothetical protein